MSPGGGSVDGRVVPARSVAEIREALRVEYDVFHALGFCAESPRGVVDEYTGYLRQSRFYVYEVDGRAMGVLREIGPGEQTLPVFAEFELDPAFRHLVGDPKVAEVGVLALRPEVQGMRAAEELYRMAWRAAAGRGVEIWGAVVEQWLLDLFVERYHFRFRRCGVPREYMGGLCIPVVMSFAETLRHMQAEDPQLYAWFTGDVPEVELARQREADSLLVPLR